MKKKKDLSLFQQTTPSVSVTIPTIPQLPITYSTTQPLPGIALNVNSVLRDILEQKLPVDTIKKLR